eukprot:CAMPEP_0185830972 /NCGR_PEP_ID=MMETSP1353-20130828/1200_1 /TAXON_ID=1077150 /ORGANISM="Erythrolobus australicus, Strain CCMP3124" /LENGTH=214 /DNA_ID=CAMNT_0028528971 /DNA_START=104 /DNA_END=748 /DNA_ORIENTATION=+
MAFVLAVLARGAASRAGLCGARFGAKTAAAAAVRTTDAANALCALTQMRRGCSAACWPLAALKDARRGALLANSAARTTLRMCEASSAAGTELIAPAEANARRESGGWKVLDVRSAEEFASARIPGSVNAALMLQTGASADLTAPGALVPNPKFVDELNALSLPRDAKLLVICGSGKRSKLAVKRLSALGYTALADVEGGMKNWKASGSLPLEH